MCYTLYLYHGFIMAFVGRFSLRFLIVGPFWLNLLIQFALLLPPMVIGSALLFVCFEKPFMRRDWPARILKVLGVNVTL